MSKAISDPLLTPDDNRYVMFPIKNQDIWTMYKKALESFWRCEEVDLAKDIVDWDKLTNEQYFIKIMLAFFAASDGIVLENLAGRFITMFN